MGGSTVGYTNDREKRPYDAVVMDFEKSMLPSEDTDPPEIPDADVPATARSRTGLHTPEALDLRFEGFSGEAFAVLERLREHPHIEQYRAEKGAIAERVTGPFQRYRDDLVLNWVLPNRLPFETERNVFSRLLKNDFGAGGCHHHLWMAFYRPPRRRLSDVQFSHSLYPDGFVFGLYVGEYAKGLFRAVRAQMVEQPERALSMLNALIGRGYTFTYAPTVTRALGSPTFIEPLAALPDDLGRAKGMWVRRKVDRETVLDAGPGLVRLALEAQAELWPLYTWWIEADAAERA